MSLRYQSLLGFGPEVSTKCVNLIQTLARKLFVLLHFSSSLQCSFWCIHKDQDSPTAGRSQRRTEGICDSCRKTDGKPQRCRTRSFQVSDNFYANVIIIDNFCVSCQKQVHATFLPVLLSLYAQHTFDISNLCLVGILTSVF